MDITPQIFNAKVMHKRLFPKENAFVYSIYYLALPLSNLTSACLPINRAGAISFHEKDHGPCDGESLETWIRTLLKTHNEKLNDITQDIVLVSLPRIFGYVFNPVSFWLCLDNNKTLRAVLCEVNNTFGEAHNYLCAHNTLEPITQDDWLQANKIFHVSPFLKREGHYKFRFALKNEKLGIWIDFYDGENKKQLITSLIGTLSPLNKKSLRYAFWTRPLITLKAITLIHWHAVKLIFKGIKHIKKPEQKEEKISLAQNVNKL